MHEVCEFGVAAHWHYKQKTKGNESVNFHEGTQYSWVRNLLEILEHADNPDEFLEHTKLEMFHDQVFCFTPKGEVIALPKSASVLDFAYAIHGEVGNKAISAKINGKQVPLRTEINNGDQIEIITSRQQHPSPGWEKYVITGKAKAQIRKFIRAKKRDQFLELGKTLLTKSLQKEGCHFDERVLTQNIKEGQHSNAEDILISIGEGTTSIKDIVKFFKPHATPIFDEKTIKLKPQKTAETFSKIPIKGLIPGMAIHYAGCCHPVLGDNIIGVVNTGKGVTIHTNDCHQLALIPSESGFLDLDWNEDSNEDIFVGRLKTRRAGFNYKRY